MRTHGVIIGLAAAALLVAACGCSKITKDNYDKIENGMTMEEVEAHLGKGTKKDPGIVDTNRILGLGEAYEWVEDGKQIVIHFKDGKVVSKIQSGL